MCCGSAFLHISILTIVLHATVISVCVLQLQGAGLSPWGPWVTGYGSGREGSGSQRSKILTQGGERGRGHLSWGWKTKWGFLQGVNLGYRKEKYFWDAE